MGRSASQGPGQKGRTPGAPQRPARAPPASPQKQKAARPSAASRGSKGIWQFHFHFTRVETREVLPDLGEIGETGGGQCRAGLCEDEVEEVLESQRGGSGSASVGEGVDYECHVLLGIEEEETALAGQ